MTSRFLPLAVTAALSAATLFAAPASAEIQRVLQLDVQYDATVLGTASGAETVLESLQDQATSACRYSRPVTGAPAQDDTCIAEIVAKAVMQIDDPELTRVYAARSGEPARFLAALQ
ncbi:MAG: UrcA family protein [Hyphomonas sp.]|nr:UrcA family protein [Hyphomonas sp.]HRX72537.1 UrcA family protein [Hyphomonas sp.]